MNVYHLYVMLQGLAALYFVVVTVPSLGIDFYIAQNPTTPISPTFPVVASSAALPQPARAPVVNVISYSDSLDEHYIYFPVRVCPAYIDDRTVIRKPGICPRPPVEPYLPLFSLPPAVVEQRQDRVPYSAVYTRTHLTVPLEGLPFESKSSSFSFDLYLLVLGLVLGGAGARGLARPSNQNQPPLDGIEDCINSEWLRHVLLVLIADDEDEQLEDYKLNNIATYLMDVF
jgi:hypothetical protein